MNTGKRKPRSHGQHPWLRLGFRVLGPLLPGPMGRLACRIWFRTRRYAEAADGQRAVEQARQETLVVNGIPVAIYVWGEGPVVLFVHGWSGRGSQVAAFTGPLTAAGYRVIAVDAPGHGNTPGTQTDILECTAVLHALERAYGPVHAALAHSFGGMVLAYAMRHGMQVARVVFFGVPADVRYLLTQFTSALGMPAAVVARLDHCLGDRFGGDFHEQVSTVANVRKLSAAALVIHDAEDGSVPWQQGAEIAEAWPGARFLETQGLGHVRILRDPHTVQAAVEFIGQPPDLGSTD